MKGLLLKDLYNIKTMLIYYVVLAAFFTVITCLSKNIFMMCSLSYLAVGAVSYAFTSDEKDKWDKTAIMSGVPRDTLVYEKFLFMLIFFVPCMALEFCVVMFTAPELFSAVVALMFVSFSTLCASISLPLFFRYGVEKVRLLFIVILVALVAAMAGLSFWFDSIDMSLHARWLIPLFIVLLVLSLALSLFASLKIYRKKEF